MKRVLVTGATTPLGAELVDGLLADPRVERVVAVGVEDRPPALSLESDRLAYVTADLTRSRDLRDLLFGVARDVGVDAVVHTAFHRSARDRGRRVRALNVEATRELLHLIERHPTIERLVFRSFAEVYRIEHDTPTLIGEDAPLELSPSAPQWVRDRVEADLTVCTRMGLAPVHIVVLRLAEILGPDSGSQLWDYLQSRVCLRPAGFDPMLNLLSVEDAVRAVTLALRCHGQGVFNIPGADTLPLSALVRCWQRRDIPVPGPLLSPLYRLRALTVGGDFRYDLNAGRLHFGAVLDGARARRELGYTPEVPIRWPTPNFAEGKPAPGWSRHPWRRRILRARG